MTQTHAVVLVIVLALVLANLPFFSSRLFGVFKMPGGKTLGIELLELTACYLFVGGVAVALERILSQVTAQRWEFFAITASLFLTLAFPGFVWRHLLQRGGAADA